jgi:4-alpha-glucanotransferase
MPLATTPLATTPFDRSSGLLLHISSLPSLGGIGDLGPAAFAFADFLAHAKQRLWQVLPLNPVGYGNSPYGSLSAFAGNPLLISLERLADWNWIHFERLGDLPGKSGNVNFEEVKQRKLPLLAEAADNFLRHHTPDLWRDYEDFCRQNASWLEDYVLFSVLRKQYRSAAWTTWPQPVARRDAEALETVRLEQEHALAIERVIQFAFDKQWRDLRHYCAQRDIRFVGDVAIFVSFDSADVWTHPDIFELNEDLSPERVSGVPPDYFSKTGQRWGNPIYKWSVLRERNFDWWVDRIRRAHALYDVIRLDHFRGFEAYWSIPAHEETAVNGEWVKAPGAELFSRLREALGELPFVAEDLGLITPEVDALRTGFQLPGMRVLQFGFNDRGAHNYLPHCYDTNTVVYTGTHDNDTTAGWWRHGANANEIHAVREYVGPMCTETGEEDVVWALIRLAATSVAVMCIFPVQDILRLGSESRMNTPSEAANNWAWRCPPGLLTEHVAEQLAALTTVSDRDGWKSPH